MTTRYVLPDLPYDYGALEPHISGRIMELHHDKHHRSYVRNANEVIERLIESRHSRNFELVGTLEKQLAFNASGHLLHSIFWQNLMRDGGGQPAGDLGRAITRDFGSFDVMKQQLVSLTSSIMGSGWGALVWDPIAKRLGTTQIHDHQSEITQAGMPLLVIDAWEHAYYLQYQTDKARYFEALWNIWNWEDVARRFQAAQQVELALSHVAEGVPAPLIH